MGPVNGLALGNSTGIEISDYLTLSIIDPGAVVDIARGTIGRIAQFLSTTFLVFLIMAFMLSEATVFPKKFRYIFGSRGGDKDRITKIATEIQSYLWYKNRSIPGHRIGIRNLGIRIGS
ncbi:MAG: hypothetical protein Ct9H300mP15_08080 [Gemmatimonadota bacterium]|nr:MAG: hypothetical protein Ct9H300mP15_08080 [Gemmatimonadota bacterium]